MNFASWLPLTAVFLAIAAVAVWHLVTHPVPYMPKWAWGLLIVVTFPVGSIVYIVVVMLGVGSQRRDAEGRHAD